jgi:hypothetical protein
MSLANPRAKGNFILGVQQSLIGSTVFSSTGENLGRIEDIVIDTRDDRVAYAVLSFGGVLGIGEKYFAVPWHAIKFNVTNQCAVLDIDRQRLENAPGFDKQDWPDMANTDWATHVERHYGVPRCG